MPPVFVRTLENALIANKWLSYVENSSNATDFQASVRLSDTLFGIQVNYCMKSMYCLASYIPAVIIVEVGEVEVQQN